MLFGVSRNKMKAVASEFGNLKNIANSSKKELNGIKSIGKKTIEQIRDTLNGNLD